MKIAEHLEKRMMPVTETGCHIWLGAVNNHGYGQLRVDGKTKYVHRLAYEQYVGQITHKKFVCHKCDTPACINPNHLFLGTQSDNILDAIKKKRKVMPDHRGEKHGLSKLTDDAVRAIRTDFRSQKIIAKEHGVSRVTISDVKNRKTWVHI